MGQPIEAIILGAGNRGQATFGAWALAHPEDIRVVAAADLDVGRLDHMAHDHGLALESLYSDWRVCVAQEAKPGRAVFICLPDALHEEAALFCLKAGLHVMLEKPAAVTSDGVRRIADAVHNSDRVFMLGHVLRHTDYFQKVRDVVQSGMLGKLVTLEWRENVSSFHFAHSYVRGNWRSSVKASPFILAKCSHDLDLIEWITGDFVEAVSSYGGLHFFKPENKPHGAPKRCIEGCPVQSACDFDAVGIYLLDGQRYWPASVISSDFSMSARQHALETGPYGQCVFQADNDVVDHHAALLRFKSGASGTFVAHGHSGAEGRSLRIDGTLATLRGIFAAGKVELELQYHDIRTALTGQAETIELDDLNGGLGAGHGGGDGGLCRAFVDTIRNGKTDHGTSELASHHLAFAIEAARLSGEWTKR